MTAPVSPFEILCMFSAYSRMELKKKGLTSEQHDAYFRVVKEALDPDTMNQRISPDRVQIPENVDQAKAMIMIGLDWVKSNAPEELKATRPNRTCPLCESPELTWHFSLEPQSGAPQDGRLRLHDVRGMFYLGCDHCSETLEALSVEDYLQEQSNAKTL